MFRRLLPLSRRELNHHGETYFSSPIMRSPLATLPLCARTRRPRKLLRKFETPPQIRIVPLEMVALQHRRSSSFFSGRASSNLPTRAPPNRCPIRSSRPLKHWISCSIAFQIFGLQFLGIWKSTSHGENIMCYWLFMWYCDIDSSAVGSSDLMTPRRSWTFYKKKKIQESQNCA